MNVLNVQNPNCSTVSSAVAEYWSLPLPSLFNLVSFFNTYEGSAYELHAGGNGKKEIREKGSLSFLSASFPSSPLSRWSASLPCPHATERY